MCLQREQTSLAIPGNGIGLTTCKRVIERLGGNIWAEATPGAGATFYFTLPKALHGRRRLRARKTNKKMKSAEMMSPPGQMDHPSVLLYPPTTVHPG